jgi:hypothetical protein
VANVLDHNLKKLEPLERGEGMGGGAGKGRGKSERERGRGRGRREIGRKEGE